MGQGWHSDPRRARSWGPAGLGDGTGQEADGWAQGPRALLLCTTRARWRQEGSLCLVPAHGQCEPSPQAPQGPGSPAGEQSLCSSKPRADPRAGSPSEGGAPYRHDLPGIAGL